MREYAVYKGDELLVIGTRKECADALNLKPSTITLYSSNAHRKRGNDSDDRIIAIKLEDDDE